MEFQPHIAVEFVVQLPRERRIGVKPRHFILVLVGHQLEQIARHRFGEAALAGRLRGLGSLGALDEIAITRGVRCVLIIGQELHAPRHHLIEGLRQAAVVGRFFHLRAQQRLDLGGIGGSDTAPAEGGMVHRHRFTVKHDGLFDRLGGKRQRAELIGIAEQENI